MIERAYLVAVTHSLTCSLFSFQVLTTTPLAYFIPGGMFFFISTRAVWDFFCVFTTLRIHEGRIKYCYSETPEAPQWRYRWIKVLDTVIIFCLCFAVQAKLSALLASVLQFHSLHTFITASTVWRSFRRKTSIGINSCSFFAVYKAILDSFCACLLVLLSIFIRSSAFISFADCCFLTT